jgi:hypothetical protein
LIDCEGIELVKYFSPEMIADLEGTQPVNSQVAATKEKRCLKEGWQRWFGVSGIAGLAINERAVVNSSGRTRRGSFKVME